MARELPDWSLPEPTLLAIIQALHQKKLSPINSGESTPRWQQPRA
jgi:hypothetical protein